MKDTMISTQERRCVDPSGKRMVYVAKCHNASEKEAVDFTCLSINGDSFIEGQLDGPPDLEAWEAIQRHLLGENDDGSPTGMLPMTIAKRALLSPGFGLVDRPAEIEAFEIGE